MDDGGAGLPGGGEVIRWKVVVVVDMVRNPRKDWRSQAGLLLCVLVSSVGIRPCFDRSPMGDHVSGIRTKASDILDCSRDAEEEEDRTSTACQLCSCVRSLVGMSMVQA